MSNYYGGGYPPPPYPYQPMYTQPPYIQRIEERLKEIEQRYAGLMQKPQEPYTMPTYNTPVNSTYESPPVQQSSPFILVKSEEDAWNYAPDWTGNKQYFYDQEHGAFYVKRFDANIPITYKEIYKKVESEQPAEQAKEKEPDLLTPRIEDMQTKLSDLEDLVYEIREMISSGVTTDVIAKRVEMDQRKDAGRRDGNESSYEDRPVRKIRRGSNGRARTNSQS